MIPPSRSSRSEYWGFLWVVLFCTSVLFLIGAVFVNELVLGIGIGVASSVCLGILGWLGNKLRKKLFPPREKLCEITFHKKVSPDFITLVSKLQIAPSDYVQTVNVFLHSRKSKRIRTITLKVGAEVSLMSKLRSIITTRVKRKRMTAWPHPDWWSHLWAPWMETNQFIFNISQPIKADIVAGDKVVESLEIENTCTDLSICEVSFIKLAVIPEFVPQGKKLRISMNVVVPHECKGVLRLDSDVEDSPQWAKGNFDVSRKYEVAK